MSLHHYQLTSQPKFLKAIYRDMCLGGNVVDVSIHGPFRQRPTLKVAMMLGHVPEFSHSYVQPST